MDLIIATADRLADGRRRDWTGSRIRLLRVISLAGTARYGRSGCLP